MFRKLFVNIFLLVSLALYWISANPPSPAYSGFVPLQWEHLEGCQLGAAPPEIFSPEKTMGTWQVEKTNGRIYCVTAPFEIKGDILELDFISSKINSTLIEVVVEGSKTISQKLPDLGTEITPNTWRQIKIPLPQSLIGSTASIRVTEIISSGSKQWSSFRNKVNFYKAKAPLAKINPYLAIVLLAFSIVLWFKLDFSLKMSNKNFIIILLLAALAIHFKQNLFFYWDEWHVIERFHKHGVIVFTKNHNEHFIPLFFGFYYTEKLLFADNYSLYILVSILLHWINCILLDKFLNRVGKNFSQIETISRLLTFMYMASAIHIEVLQWAFTQCVLLSQLFVFICLNTGWDYLMSGKLKNAFISALSAFFSPFCFGNGLNLVPQLAVVLAFLGIPFFLSSTENSKPNKTSGLILRLFTLALLTGIAMISSAYIYYINRQNAEVSLGLSNPLEHIPGVLRYILVGTQLGTVLRGLGLFPSLSLTGVAEIIPQKIFSLLSYPEEMVALVGLFISLILLIVGLVLTKHKTNSFRLWLTGQTLACLVLLLPALGRLHFRIYSALSLRYQYGALIGLILMLLATVPLKRVQTAEDDFNEKKLSLNFIIMILLFGYFSSQLSLGVSYTEYTNKGRSNFNYIQQLKDWNQTLFLANPTAQDRPIEGTDTPYEGLFPILPETLTPQRHPDRIYSVVYNMNPKRYPARNPVSK